MRYIALIAFATLLAGCSDDDGARRTLVAMGYSDVQVTGFAWWGCGKDDSVHTGFTARSPTGVKVSGVVCSGWGWFSKGYTVRFS